MISIGVFIIYQSLVDDLILASEKMYKFFMSLKQPDGSFIVSKNAEVDVRAVYSVLVTATLLDMLTPELVAGTASFIASAQTYEGGFASASAPYYISNDTFLDEPRPALGEAHGGYAGCAIASWVMLEPFIKGGEVPKLSIPKFLRWLVWMQSEPTDIGGFRGRSNKLVDNCYSWWCGGSLAIVESLLDTREETGDELDIQEDNTVDEGDWEDTDWWLYDNSRYQVLDRNPALNDRSYRGPARVYPWSWTRQSGRST